MGQLGDVVSGEHVDHLPIPQRGGVGAERVEVSFYLRGGEGGRGEGAGEVANDVAVVAEHVHHTSFLYLPPAATARGEGRGWSSNEEEADDVFG